MNQADKTRLLLNSTELANRWVEFCGERRPILHLSLGDLERFRVYCVPIEALYLRFAESERPFTDFLALYADDVISVLQESVPEAAAIALRMPTTKIVAAGRPLEAFHAILAQWVHNLEIGALQTAFPAPESDPDEKDTPDQGNPLSTVQKLLSAYHGLSMKAALKLTTPQVYLLGVDAAWTYESVKSDGKKTRRTAPPAKKGEKRWKSAAEYQAYVQGLQGNMPGVFGVI